MKRILVYIISLLFLLNMSFAFDIYDSEDNLRKYFSMEDPLVFIKSTENHSNYTVEFNLAGGGTDLRTFNLSSCDLGKVCGDFSLLDLISSDNSSFSGAVVFDVILNNETKQIYLDIEKPKLTIDSYKINVDKKTITLNFTATDNYEVKKVDLYEKNSSTLTKIAEVTNKTSYNVSLKKEGEITFLFKIFDTAGNIYEIEKDYDIPDLFKPEIISTKVVYKEEKYELYFKIKDKNLSYYEIVQHSVKVTGNTTGTEYEKSITLPFNSGTILFRAFDKFGNEINKSLSLNTPIDISFNSKFSKDKTLKFSSNADICILTNIDNNNYNKEFDKSSKTFSYNLPISSVRNYEIKFYCDKGDYRQYYSRDFYYDTNEPEEVDLTIEKTDDGYLMLDWDESNDKESEVKYSLYRDGDRIYSGTKTSYEDEDVSYPDSYEYYLKVEDEAGNYVESNEVEDSPLKVDVTIKSNLLKEQETNSENMSFRLTTDKNSNIIIKIKNSGNVIFERALTGVDENVQLNLKLNEGVNEIFVEVTDEFQNKRSQSYFVTYTKPVLTENEQQPVVVEKEPVKEQVVKSPVIQTPANNTNLTSQSTSDDESSYSFWLWVLFWLVVFAIFTWYFVFNEDKLREKISTRNKRSGADYLTNRKKDFVLGKSLEKIKNNRIQKQRELKLRKEREAERQKKEVTELQKKKHEDISRRKEVVIPFDVREKSKKKLQRVRKTEDYETSLNETPKEKEKSSKGFFGMFSKKEPEKTDEFSMYLKNKKSAGFDNTHDYVAKPTPEVKKEEKKEVKQDVKKVQEEPETVNEPKQERQAKSDKLSLDDYLSKRTKKKRFYFVEKEVERDLSRRD